MAISKAVSGIGENGGAWKGARTRLKKPPPWTRETHCGAGKVSTGKAQSRSVMKTEATQEEDLARRAR